MVMPSSTPRLLGSFTWKVPLLGMTDSGYKQMWIRVRPGLTPILVWLGGTPKSHFPKPILLLPLDRLDQNNQFTWSEQSWDWDPDLMTASQGFPTAKPNPIQI